LGCVPPFFGGTYKSTLKASTRLPSLSSLLSLLSYKKIARNNSYSSPTIARRLSADDKDIFQHKGLTGVLFSKRHSLNRRVASQEKVCQTSLRLAGPHREDYKIRCSYRGTNKREAFRDDELFFV